MGDSEPISVNFEVRRLAVNITTRLEVAWEGVSGCTQLTMQETAAPWRQLQRWRIAPMKDKAQPLRIFRNQAIANTRKVPKSRRWVRADPKAQLLRSHVNACGEQIRREGQVSTLANSSTWTSQTSACATPFLTVFSSIILSTSLPRLLPSRKKLESA